MPMLQSVTSAKRYLSVACKAYSAINKRLVISSKVPAAIRSNKRVAKSRLVEKELEIEIELGAAKKILNRRVNELVEKY